MSDIEKMQVVVNSLRENLDVTVVGGVETSNLSSGEWPERSLGLGSWEHTLDIYAHPSMPIYDADDLNDFLHILVPEVEPDYTEPFKVVEHFERKELHFGHLTYYDKDIGCVALMASVRLNKGSTLVGAGLEPEWQAKRTIMFRQSTRLSIFPDAGHLADAGEGRNKYWVDINELGNAGPGRVVGWLLESPTLNRAVAEDSHQLSLSPLL